MTVRGEPMREDPLAARLRALEFPESAGLAYRVIDRYRSPARRRVGLRLAAIATAVAVLLLGTAAAAVAVPGSREALAATPLVGPIAHSILRLGGLNDAGQRVTPLQGAATSAGETISLMGGYADNQRTVVIVHVEPARSIAQPVTLAVDNARVPLTRPVVSPTTAGDVVLVFGPIVSPKRNGNALTLHVTELGPILSPVGLPPPGPDRVAGDWTLRLTLAVDRSAAVAAPAPGQLGNLGITFTASVVGTDVQVSAHMRGVTIAQLLDMRSYSDTAKGSTVPPGPRAWRMELVEETGREVPWLNGALARGDTPTDFTADYVWSVPAPGTYLIVVSWEGYSVVRTIVVR
jgi:hypothetical protein